MKHKQRRARLRKRQQHTDQRWQERKQATLDAIDAIRRGKKKVSAQNMAKEMSKRGFMPNGKGGWKRMPQAQANDTISKS